MSEAKILLDTNKESQRWRLSLKKYDEPQYHQFEIDQWSPGLNLRTEREWISHNRSQVSQSA